MTPAERAKVKEKFYFTAYLGNYMYIIFISQTIIR